MGDKSQLASTARRAGERLRLACAIALLFAGCNDATGQGGEPKGLPGGDRGPGSVERLGQSAMHTVHAAATPTITCAQCHEEVGGQFLRAKSWPCKKCHADAPLTVHATTAGSSKASECWTCHDFSAEAKGKSAIACATCHAKPQGGLPAITAHDPAKPDEDCGSCHRAHEEPSLVDARCESCHQEPVSGHAKKDIPITGCASCHGYHEKAVVASGRCTNCHRQSRAQVSHNATFKDGHDKCVTCHRPHRFFKPQVIGCQDLCHENVVALSQDKVAKHRGCIGCHDNHDVRESPQKACETCHGRKINPRHPKDKASGTRCVGCHKPHQGAGTPVAVACSSCHDAVQSDRGFHQGPSQRGPQCRDCHKPHEFALARAGVALCSSCHGDRPFKNAKTIRTSVKHANCLGCHGDTVRHQPAGPRAACATCHKDKGAAVRKGHTKCVGCHDAHTGKQEVTCGSCHKDQAHSARKDHKNCTNCHDPHTGQPKKQCGSCHQPQASSAPEKHQQCMTCHDQHSTLVKKQCRDCHADRATGVHAPVPGGCVSCHRPHGPGGHARPPACASCHKPENLGLMHEIQQHRTCSNCHRSHGDQPNQKRATCLACHKDKVNHEPDATMCVGCHVFGGEQ